MTTAPDPYAVLGLTPEASDDDLDHAFRSLVRQLHPDTRTPPEPGPDADKRLQELLTAYATLRDPISRAAHDRAHTRPTTPRTAVTPHHHGPPAAQHVHHSEPAIRVGPVRWVPLAPGPGATAPSTTSKRNGG